MAAEHEMDLPIRKGLPSARELLQKMARSARMRTERTLLDEYPEVESLQFLSTCQATIILDQRLQISKLKLTLAQIEISLRKSEFQKCAELIIEANQ